MNIGHDYTARVREGKSVFSMSAFHSVSRAIDRHDLLGKWHKANLIHVSPFCETWVTALSMLKESSATHVRIVAGDTYVDEPIGEFPSERLIATIALVLQARGEL